MSHKNQPANDAQMLSEKIKDIRIAMMTTIESDGTLHSRPMVTQDLKSVEFDGDLWFLTRASAPKVSEIEQHEQINLSYEQPKDNLFVSVSGTAQFIRDSKKIHELWKPFYETWFPGGEDDPDIALLKVHVHTAEYWDAPAGKMGLFYSILKKGASEKNQTGSDVKLHIG